MTQTTKYIIAIGGPTASGKTALSLALAHHFNTEIISADSRQIYREMTIGTAKIQSGEMQNIPHHLIDCKSIHDSYSVGDFERDAIDIIHRLHKKFDVVILVGGTGLYLNALLEGIDEFPDVPTAIIDHYQSIYTHHGIQPLQSELVHKDPDYADKVDLENSRRVIRALAVIATSRKTFSSFLNQPRKKRPFTAIKIALAPNRKQLYDHINARVDLMIDQGLLQECKTLYPYKSLRSLQTVGYSEIFDHFDGKYTLEEAIHKIKQHSRNYAKRQLTWFRNQGEWQLYETTDKASIISFIDQQLAYLNK